jgi:hypothetical protein
MWNLSLVNTLGPERDHSGPSVHCRSCTGQTTRAGPFCGALAEPSDWTIWIKPLGYKDHGIRADSPSAIHLLSFLGTAASGDHIMDTALYATYTQADDFRV